MSWCIYTKHWFRADDLVEFHIIDEMGNDIVLNFKEHNTLLRVNRNKICIVIHDSDENNIKENNTDNDNVYDNTQNDLVDDKDDNIIDSNIVKEKDSKNIVLKQENKEKDD
jgi:hypothetical protein